MLLFPTKMLGNPQKVTKMLQLIMLIIERPFCLLILNILRGFKANKSGMTTIYTNK